MTEDAHLTDQNGDDPVQSADHVGEVDRVRGEIVSTTEIFAGQTIQKPLENNPPRILVNGDVKPGTYAIVRVDDE